MSEAAANERAEIIDQYGDLYRTVREFKPTADKCEALRKQIASWYEGLPGSDAFLAEGVRYNVQISQKQPKRKITDIRALWKMLGDRVALTLCSFSLKDLDAHLQPGQMAQVMSCDHDGPRRLEPVLRPIPIDTPRKKRK